MADAQYPYQEERTDGDESRVDEKEDVMKTMKMLISMVERMVTSPG